MTDQLDELEQRGVLGAIDRHCARALGRIAGGAEPEVLLGAAFASQAVQRGHVCVDLARLSARPLCDADEREITGVELPSLAIWRQQLASSPLVGDGSRPTPLVLEGDRLYLYRYARYQQQLASAIAARLGRGFEVDAATARAGLDRLFPETVGMAGPDLQRRAAAVALQRAFCVVSGGPGTGKTSTVVKILALLQEQALAAGGGALRIAVLAPTGKAAQRLGAAIAAHKTGLECSEQVLASIPDNGSTIHRALGYLPHRPTRFRRHRGDPLPFDVVLVDEASMVDLPLFAKLACAVPAEGRLILLGDKDQLASVEVGAILGDICGDTGGMHYTPAFAAATEALCGEPLPVDDDSSPVDDSVVHLTHSWRYGEHSSIAALARAVKAGEGSAVVEALEAGAETALVPVSGSSDLGALLEPAVAAAFADYRDGDPETRLRQLESFRVLCCHRRDDLGVEAVNALVEQLMVRAGVLRTDGEWYDGRPVMILRNDYQLGLFNGDVGVIACDGPGGAPQAWFAQGDELRAVPASRLPQHETVFAMTIHKSQGSEFDHVALLLPARPSPITTRELIYTGVTRARQSVRIYGSVEVLRDAIGRRIERKSGLAERISAGIGGSSRSNDRS